MPAPNQLIQLLLIGALDLRKFQRARAAKIVAGKREVMASRLSTQKRAMCFINDFHLLVSYVHSIDQKASRREGTHGPSANDVSVQDPGT